MNRKKQKGQELINSLTITPEENGYLLKMNDIYPFKSLEEVAAQLRQYRDFVHLLKAR